MVCHNQEREDNTNKSVSCIIKVHSFLNWASLVAQLVKNPPAMQKTPVQFLGGEDLLEKG